MEQYESKIMQQLGIVSGVCNEIKLAETSDRIIHKPQRKVSIGKAVQAMILNNRLFYNPSQPNLCDNPNKLYSMLPIITQYD